MHKLFSTLMFPATVGGEEGGDEALNPLSGVTPDITVFGVEFNGAVQLILAGIWGLVLAVVAGAVLVALGKWAWATRVSHNKDSIAEGSAEFKKAIIVFGVTVGVSFLLGSVIFIVQKAMGS